MRRLNRFIRPIIMMGLMTVVLAGATSAVFAQQSSSNYAIYPDVISGGGGESGSSGYNAEHTTGQSTAVGESSSTNYYNFAGFWYSVGGTADEDSDGDGVPDSIDNCVQTPNAGQQDTNGDGYGNICDADLDNDGAVGFLDFNAFKLCWLRISTDPLWPGQCEHADFDSDNAVGFLDFNIFKGRWLSTAPWY